MGNNERTDYVIWPVGQADKPTLIHDTDHGKPKSHPNPHAQDRDGDTYGKPRPLNDVEKAIYEND